MISSVRRHENQNIFSGEKRNHQTFIVKTINSWKWCFKVDIMKYNSESHEKTEPSQWKPSSEANTSEQLRYLSLASCR
jgi:hypothetical protein